MQNRPEFLVVDEHHDNRFLLTKTLLRKFPNALIHECVDSEPAIEAVGRPGLIAVVAHRTFDLDNLSLIEALRKANPTLPILAVSGIDRREGVFRAGANAFMHFDAWLTVGTAVEEMLRAGKTRSPFDAAGPGSISPLGADTCQV